MERNCYLCAAFELSISSCAMLAEAEMVNILVLAQLSVMGD